MSWWDFAVGLVRAKADLIQENKELNEELDFLERERKKWHATLVVQQKTIEDMRTQSFKIAEEAIKANAENAVLRSELIQLNCKYERVKHESG